MRKGGFKWSAGTPTFSGYLWAPVNNNVVVDDGNVRKVKSNR